MNHERIRELSNKIIKEFIHSAHNIFEVLEKEDEYSEIEVMLAASVSFVYLTAYYSTVMINSDSRNPDIKEVFNALSKMAGSYGVVTAKRFLDENHTLN